LRSIILTAAMTGLRMSELRGLRWRDIDWTAQRIRVRNTYVRHEHDADGKSEISTKRSVPMTTLLAGLLDGWSQRTIFNGDLNLVFAHPQTGKPLDRSKVLKRFKAACKDAKVPVIRFHDLRHTFGSRRAACRYGRSKSSWVTPISRNPNLRALRALRARDPARRRRFRVQTGTDPSGGFAHNRDIVPPTVRRPHATVSRMAVVRRSHRTSVCAGGTGFW
jgi:hypothetical protein